MPTDEIARLQAENKRLQTLVVYAERERQRIERLALQTLDDLAEQIGWTSETESQEIADAAITDFSLALHAPSYRRATTEDRAYG